jgi:lysophospholipase L1-like esterase
MGGNFVSRWIGVCQLYFVVGVVNAGINGNTLLCTGMERTCALRRLDRDVFSVTGLSIVVVLIGINDIRKGTNDFQTTLLHKLR